MWPFGGVFEERLDAEVLSLPDPIKRLHKAPREGSSHDVLVVCNAHCGFVRVAFVSKVYDGRLIVPERKGDPVNCQVIRQYLPFEPNAALVPNGIAHFVGPLTEGDRTRPDFAKPRRRDDEDGGGDPWSLGQ